MDFYRLSMTVKIAIAIGILASYALVFYIAVLAIWPSFNKKYGPFKHPTKVELLLRVIVALVACMY